MASTRQFDRSRFDHVGVVTEDRQENESWVEATRVWVTSPRSHPFNVEFLRFEPDRPVTGPLRAEPHVAYRGEAVHRAPAGHTVLAQPCHPRPPGFVPVACAHIGGGAVAFMDYT